MIRNILSSAIALALALAAPRADACGEGQFNMGAGLRYQGYLAPHPATVLIYDDGRTDHSSLYAGLQKAGHHVTVVGDIRDLSAALGAKRYDVLITKLDDIDAVAHGRAETASIPRLLPVAQRTARDASLLQRFPAFVFDGAGLGQYLKAINQLLTAHAP